MVKNWKLRQADEVLVQQLSSALTIQRTFGTLLLHRGISNFQEAKNFFRPELAQLHDPFLMKDMNKAVHRISEALKAKEKIMVYGDYDVDGTTAVAVVYSFLNKNFPKNEFCYYIPHRYREGYGISFEGIEEAFAQSCSLIIALDCGIKSTEKVAYAFEKGIDFIICDHHLPGDSLPQAAAILNPKQQECHYPYPELSGCGIGFKLISALAHFFEFPFEKVSCYLDLVATSIAADIVPMDGENRVLSFWGLKKLNENPCLPLKMIFKVAEIQKSEYKNSDLVFIVAPRINAAGRMGDAMNAVRLLIEEDESTSKEFAIALHRENDKRKKLDAEITKDALNMLSEQELLKQYRSTVLFREDWHKGVVGIVASRLTEKYYRPTIVLTKSGEMISGSARSVAGFNIYEAIHQCADLLENFGGHFFAAGMTLRPEKLIHFQNKFEEVVASTITPESLMQTLEIDAELKLRQITPKFFQLIQQFEPFGPGNPKPIFISRKVSDWRNYSCLLQNQHIKFVVAQEDGHAFTGIGFDLGQHFHFVENGKQFDIVYTIEENIWKDKSTLQLHVLDIKASKE